MAAFDAFTIPNSPKNKNNGENSAKQKEILTLAPFNRPPKIVFQSVRVGHSASQEVDIYNPSSADVQVELSSKAPLADHKLVFSSTNFKVCASEKFVLKITWRPVEAGTFKIPIGVRTNTKFRSDFVILCVAVPPVKADKKVLKPENRNNSSVKPKPAAVPVPRVVKPASEPPARRKTFVLHGNKENVACQKTLAPPEPAPRKLSPVSPIMRPHLVENLVVSPFISASTRFRDVELSPAVHGPWKEARSPPALEPIRRQTYGVDQRAALPAYGVDQRAALPAYGVDQRAALPAYGVDQRAALPAYGVDQRAALPAYGVDQRAALPTYGEDQRAALPVYGANLENFEEKPDTVDFSFREPDSFAFDPPICSTTFKIQVPREGSLGSIADCNDRLSGGTYILDRLSSETFVKESDFNEHRSPFNERPSSSHADHSGSILESISEEADPREYVTVFEISPPKQLGTKRAWRMSPKVITKRKVAVSPVIRIFSPDTQGSVDTANDETNPRKSIAPPVPKVALPRLTLTRGPTTRRSVCGATLPRSTHLRKKTSLASAASSSRESVASTANLSRQSVASTANSSRQSVASTINSSRQSVSSSSRQSLASTVSSSRQSFASAVNSSNLSLASAASSSRQSLASARSLSRQSLSNMSFQSCSSRVSNTKARREKSEFLFNTDALINEMINNDVLAASSSADPFLMNSLFYDDSWKLKQEKDMIKWLNVLLTPPDELTSNSDSVDIAEVWQHCCRTQQVDLAPTREDVSSNVYDAQARLNSLRKAAFSLLAKTELRQVLGKVSVHIDKKLLMVREDKDLHLDTGLKYQVVELLLSYNPLWLRIGLEAMYGRTISLTSNSDVVGLARFMVENLLYDKSIVAMHSHPHVPHLRLPTFGDAMKKFILKKFFFLVYFLDRAKANKLIGHDPCLFLKNAKYKESKEILIAFASKFLSGVGDIVKHLALLGYHVKVKQQYLDEYEFAVTCLKDLRDGVRLTRAMEIILKNDTLLEKLRVPAGSLSRKIHNMEVALQALSNSGYVILGNITAKDLVNGHHEKTLSLLWQIIYKFQAPRLEQAAKVIQSWWRNRQLFCVIKNRIMARRIAKCVAAAVRIQAAWRAHTARKRVVLLRAERAAELVRRESAAIIIQKTWRMYAARKQLLRARKASNRIKEWYTGALITREVRAKFLAKREAVIKIQSLLRGYVTRKRFAHLRRTAAALRIQTWFRRRRAARLLERASTLSKKWVEERQRQRRACIIIQSRLRAHLEMKKQRNKYIELRSAAIVIQRRFRMLIVMKRDRAAFMSIRRSVIICQQAFRAKCAMKQQHAQYLAAKQSAVVIQRWFRAKLEMRKVRTQFVVEKAAAIKIQTWFRATRQMRSERQEFLRMKQAVKVIEARYSAQVETRRQERVFVRMRTSAIAIQCWYRNVKQMKSERCAFVEKRRAALVIQRAYRASKLRQRRISSAVVIQRKWRATLEMRAERRAYTLLRSSAVYLQSWWRSVLLMRVEKTRYEKFKTAALVIQVKWRAVLAGRKARTEYLTWQNAAKVIQRRWRAKVAMQRDRANYLRIRSAAIVTQRHWKEVLRRRQKKRLTKAVIFVQRVWRAKKEAERRKKEALTLERAAVFIQRKYRMKMHQRARMTEMRRRKQAAIKIQAVWRGYTVRKKRCAAIALINERFRVATESASEEKTLSFKFQKAINDITQQHNIIQGLVAMGKVTALSRELCVCVARSDLVTNIYDILSGCNRSQLHREFLTSGTFVLVNLSKFHLTVPFIWQNGSRVFFYLHLMNVWIDKDREIFLNCATVLWHFSLYPEYAEEMIADPRTSRLLDIFARKASKKQSSSKDGFILPSETPSWGLILNDNKPTKFQNVQFAVGTLQSELYKHLQKTVLYEDLPEAVA